MTHLIGILNGFTYY